MYAWFCSAPVYHCGLLDCESAGGSRIITCVTLSEFFCRLSGNLWIVVSCGVGWVENCLSFLGILS